MIWVVVSVLVASMGLNMLLSVLVYRASVHGSRLLDESHARTTRYTEGLVDRLMAADFGTFKAYEMMQPTSETAAESPELDLEPVMGPDRGGWGSRLGLAGYRPPEDEIRPEEEMS